MSFKRYVKVGELSIPDGSKWTIDAMPLKGRVLALDGDKIVKQRVALSSDFIEVGKFAGGSQGMLRISPDANRAILVSYKGDKFWIFSTATGKMEHEVSDTGCSFYDAEWHDNQFVAITLSSMDEGSVLRIYNADTGKGATIVNKIGSASGGVTFDDSGRLFAGNGSDSSLPSDTGLVRAFEKKDWMDALAGNQVLDFFNSSKATTIANILSAGYMGFDRFGNLHVGGGDNTGSNDNDYCAVLFRKPLSEILLGNLPILESSSPQVPLDLDGIWQRFDPDPDVNKTWVIAANRASGQLYLKDYNSDKRHVFALEEFNQSGTTVSRKLLTCLHFGDTEIWPPYMGYAFVGMGADLPFPGDLPASVASAKIKLWAREVESWMGTTGHQIFLGGVQLDNLKDPNNQKEPDYYECSVTADQYKTAISNSGGNVQIRIEVENLTKGYADDFLLDAYGIEFEESSSA